MNDKMIIDIIEKSLEKKMFQNCNFIKYSYYEIRVNYGMKNNEINRFLELIKLKLQNMNYSIYFVNEQYEYENIEKKVKENELLVAKK